MPIEANQKSVHCCYTSNSNSNVVHKRNFEVGKRLHWQLWEANKDNGKMEKNGKTF